MGKTQPAPTEELTKIQDPAYNFPHPSNNKKLLIVGMAIALLTSLGTAGYFGYQNYQIKHDLQTVDQQRNSSADFIETISPTITFVGTPSQYPDPIIEDTDVPNQKRFVSPRNKLSFLYQTVSGGHQITAKEIGNKIFIHYQASRPDSGQYLEIFFKKPGQAFQQALEETILDGYSPADCKVVDSFFSRPTDFPTSYKILNISTTKISTDISDPFAGLENCPSPYTVSNGISYFLYDENHPDKFLFFSIGQYAIFADDNTAWQDTIKFLD